MQYYVGMDQFCFLVQKITRRFVALEGISWKANKPWSGKFLAEAAFSLWFFSNSNVVTVKVYGYKQTMVCMEKQDFLLAQLMPLENQISFQAPQPFCSFTKGH